MWKYENEYIQLCVGTRRQTRVLKSVCIHISIHDRMCKCQGALWRTLLIVLLVNLFSVTETAKLRRVLGSKWPDSIEIKKKANGGLVVFQESPLVRVLVNIRT